MIFFDMDHALKIRKLKSQIVQRNYWFDESFFDSDTISTKKIRIHRV